MMEWGSFANFLAMGGYAPYVWGSYGVTLLAIVIELVLLARQGRTTLQRLKRMKQWDAAHEGEES